MKSSSPPPPSHHLPTVVAIAVVTYTSAIMLHEGAHAVAGVLVGGDSTMISSTDLRGDWSGVTTPGYVLISVSGSLINAMLAALGVFLLWSKRVRTDAQRFFAWLMLAVNGFVAGFGPGMAL